MACSSHSSTSTISRSVCWLSRRPDATGAAAAAAAAAADLIVPLSGFGLWCWLCSGASGAAQNGLREPMDGRHVGDGHTQMQAIVFTNAPVLRVYLFVC
jgi:hypothetical protein